MDARVIIMCYIVSFSSSLLVRRNAAPFLVYDTTKKRKFSIKDFFSKCDQMRSKLRIWSHLQKKYSMENFIFCAV